MHILIDKLLTLWRPTAWVLHSLVPLLTRLMIGYAFYQSGHGKFYGQGLDAVTEFFRSLGIPAPGLNAVFIASLELVGGIAVMLGFGTRIFAALLSCTMVVAMVTASRHDIVKAFPADLLDKTEPVYLILLLWLVAFGPGLVSLDRLISLFWARSRQESTESALRQSHGR